MADRKSGPQRVGDLVEAVLDGRGLREQVERIEALELWSRRVGDRIAEVTRAREVSGSTLFVEVRSSAWLSELNMMKGSILERLNEGRPGESRIERLVFVLGEDG